MKLELYTSHTCLVRSVLMSFIDYNETKITTIMAFQLGKTAKTQFTQITELKCMWTLWQNVENIYRRFTFSCIFYVQ